MVSLDLRNKPISDVDIHRICEWLGREIPFIDVIDLRGSIISASAVNLLFKALIKNTRLTRIQMFGSPWDTSVSIDGDIDSSSRIYPVEESDFFLYLVNPELVMVKRIQEQFNKMLSYIVKRNIILKECLCKLEALQSQSISNVNYIELIIRKLFMFVHDRGVLDHFVVKELSYKLIKLIDNCKSSKLAYILKSYLYTLKLHIGIMCTDKVKIPPIFFTYDNGQPKIDYHLDRLALCNSNLSRLENNVDSNNPILHSYLSHYRRVKVMCDIRNKLDYVKCNTKAYGL